MANITYITTPELLKLDSSTLLICDIREPSEYAEKNIPGAINTPLSNFDINKINELSKEKILVFHCQSGRRTKISEPLLKELDAEEIFILGGGINEWISFQ